MWKVKLNLNIKKFTRSKLLLWSQDLRVDQEKEPCISLTQENLIENSIQDYLPYILKGPGLC